MKTRSQCWVSSVALYSEVAHYCGQAGWPVENVLVCGTLSTEVTWSHSHACILHGFGGGGLKSGSHACTVSPSFFEIGCFQTRYKAEHDLEL